LPDYLLKRLQKVQNAAASFVIGKFAKVNDIGMATNQRKD
jgi:hypothetical protein